MGQMMDVVEVMDSEESEKCRSINQSVIEPPSYA